MRSPSLASRFLATLVVSCVLPLLLYGWFSLRAMRSQIDEQLDVFLPQLAADHAGKMEARLDQVCRAVAVVREIARRVLDAGAEPRRLDAEIEAFEEQVLPVPDLLDNYLDLLLLAEPGGRIVFWQDGQLLDRNTRQQRASLLPKSVAGQEWFVRAQVHRGAFFQPWGRSPLLHRGCDWVSFDPAAWHMGYVVDVPHADGPPGVLLALIRWPQFQQVLDDARQVLVDQAGLASAQAMLVDGNGRICGHTDRQNYAALLQPASLREAVAHGPGGRIEFDDGGRRHVAGFATLQRIGLRDWSLVLRIPRAELFARSDAFVRVLAIAIGVTVFVLIVWSLVASRAIVRPVQDLVAATQRVAHGDLAVRVPAAGGPELGGLARAFNLMAGELAAGREKLKSAERERAWAEMARQVAHEIKNPLTPMRMVAQLLLKARKDGDARAEMVAERLAKTVLEQTEALDRIAADFRQFAGSPQRRVETVALDALVAEVHAAGAALFSAGALHLEHQPGATGVFVAVDRTELARVFVNLLQNAVQAMAPAPAMVQLRTGVRGERAFVTIIDAGPGIPDAVRGRLFEPYFTTKTAGTGLGLAICRRVVEANGGTIQLARSAPGHTEFVIELPLAGPPTAS
ncbi:MAG: sensor histidine kinase [Planctomycetes bacterium]|nr:sensor histidine kinase [Planctomycetota bacterium]